MSLPKDFLKIFEAHGVDFTGERGNQMYGLCPFSGKNDKFYVNMDNGLWDSKSAGLSGNVYTFLSMRSKNYQSDITGKKLRLLAENRQLPTDAFKPWEIGWDAINSAYTLPVRDPEGRVHDIRRYNMRSGMVMSTAGCHVGLLGAHRLKAEPGEVYLCEGEWDTIALHWLLRSLKEDGAVIGVPGAGTFKKEWIPWLRGRTVNTLYDNDPPGEKGELAVKAKLAGTVKKLTFIHWPDDVPQGFDTRDWIVYGTTIRNTPEKCWERLRRRFYDVPKTEQTVERRSSTGAGKITIKGRKLKKRQWEGKAPTLQDVHKAFNKWLFLKNTDVIDVMLSTVMTQRLDGSPVWMMIVGPPGSAKTVMVSTLQNASDQVHFTSSLTSASLISGMAVPGNDDPSLIAKLKDKVLVVKDFTTILSLPDREQKEIFGILRDAYDGKCGKTFGNGIVREYEHKFTVLVATTPKIYDLADQHQALGERFLKFLVGDNLHHLSEDEVIRRAIENSDKETAMKEELSDIVKAFLENTTRNYKHPETPSDITQKIISLSKFGARLRGTVSRDFYRQDIMNSRPMAELGTRLGQQLAKLARGLAMVYGRDKVTEAEFNLIKKVMLDTISQRNEDVLRAMIGAMGGTAVLTPMSMREIALKTHYPFATIQRLMQDLIALEIVERHGSGTGTTWTLSEYVKREVIKSTLYSTDDELTRPTSGKIRMVIRRAKKAHKNGSTPTTTHVTASISGSKITITPTATAALRTHQPGPGGQTRPGKRS